MDKELNILEIVKEDILRILGEKEDKKILLKSIKSEIKVSNTFIFRAIGELKRETLIQFKESFILLTKKGQDKAKNIIEKHLLIEDYFKKTRSKEEAHKIAHILEHYISEEVINNIKKLSTLKGKGIPLTKFRLNKATLITDVVFKNSELFERIVSMGMPPGERIIVRSEIPNAIIVETKNKKFALGKNLAKRIRVLKYEKT